ncbi:MAG: hypothetical protein MI806_12995 [Minwuiales bacterium]|nr:hypothetical protein [Minwuiales bacterium]
MKLFTPLIGIAALVVAAGPAVAHGLPGPHAHPHGLEHLALAGLALAIVVGLAVAGIGAARRTKPTGRGAAYRIGRGLSDISRKFRL